MFPSVLPDTAAECVAELEELERLKSALCARQARVTARLDEPDLRAAGTGRVSEKAMATEVGLARRESPSRGGRFLRLARALVEDHPLVLGLLESGDLNERRAEIIVNETSHLPLAERRAADAAVVDKLTELPCLGDRALGEEVRRIVYRLDSEAATRRREKALRDRHVRARSRADGTGEVTGVVADWQMAAIMASLGARADLLLSQGDERTRAQILADLFVERLAGLPGASAVPVMRRARSARTSPGFDALVRPRKLGRVACSTWPAPRRSLVPRDRLAASIAMETRTRLFPKALAEFIRLRDRRCRTPWCDAPIRHTDHIHDAAQGGDTSEHNGQALCASCNYTKQHPDLDHTVTSTADLEPHTTVITTPAGASYDSRAPAPPGNAADHFIQTRPGVWTRIA